MKKQKKKRTSSFFLVLFLFILLIFLIVFFTPFFCIKGINVYGNQFYTEEMIVSAIDVKLGDNGLSYLDGEAASITQLRFLSQENKLDKLPRIKSSIISYKLPGKVEISIEEREGVAYLKYMGNNLLIDRDGYIIDVVGDTQKDTYTEIRGVNFDRYILGGKLETNPQDVIQTIVMLIKIIQQSDSKTEINLMNKIDWIDVRKPDDLLLSLDNRIIVKLGDMSELPYRIEFLKQIYFSKTKSDESGMIDFTRGQNPSFIPEK